ncbi:methyl-accepting chemotaxis protein [Pseudomonas sp. NFACC15-1]|nr:MULTISPECIES: methyl-accepting chemotaxis protein [unclassified Pseudomonas]SDA92109.1 methyl-accepting chemotaxis protein [Pseudomonas sp. NFACC15-1]SDY72097.1 methyl-accepting chemotaxis protein [Pseudomonas sp. NFACC14]
MANARLSIQQRVTLLVGICLLLIVGGLTALSLFKSAINTSLVKERSTEALGRVAEQRLLAEGMLQSQTVKSHLLASYELGRNFAVEVANLRLLAHREGLEPSLIRGELADLLNKRLSTNSQLLSMFLIFEPNALDGVDAQFLNQQRFSSNEQGRFSLYSSQADGKLTSKPTPEATITDQTPGLDGSPFSTWYDCPKATAKPCLLSPYFDDASGQRTLITTLSFPIMENGKVIGVAGMDISLGKLQEIVEIANKSLYEGAGSISILTPTGLLAGYSADASKLGQNLEETDDKNSQTLLTKLKHGDRLVESRQGTLTSLIPMQPIPDSAFWGILLSAPETKVLAPAIALQQELDVKSSDNAKSELVFGLLAALAGLILVWSTARGVTRPILGVASMLKDIAGGGGDLTKRLHYNRQDELGELSSWFNRFLDILQPLIADIQRVASEASQTADHSAHVANKIHSDMQQQFHEVDLVATASQELSSSALDVAQNAASAAQAAREADGATRNGLDVILLTTNAIQGLSQEFADARDHVESLAQKSDRIGSVLRVIHSIAEQTNLLALNAAIEAARAGESGRGFAVVADEVRNLARHTRDSIEEIREVIEEVQHRTIGVVAAMRNGTARAADGVEQVGLAAKSFREIDSAVSIIKNMNLQIASAAEQQSRVAEEVSRSVATIRDVTESLSTQTLNSRQASETLNIQASEQLRLTGNFKT